MNQAAIREAIDNLDFLNVKLRQSTIEVDEKIDIVEPEHLRQQNMMHIEAEVIEDELENVGGDPADLLQVMVTLGSRFVKNTGTIEHEAEAEAEIEEELARVEAVYMLEYLMKSKIGEDALKEFCEFNAVHNCWSFWREHVHSSCQKAQIPIFHVPFFKR